MGRRRLPSAVGCRGRPCTAPWNCSSSAWWNTAAEVPAVTPGFQTLNGRVGRFRNVAMAAVQQPLGHLSAEQRQVVEVWLVEFDQAWHPGLLAERAPLL